MVNRGGSRRQKKKEFALIRLLLVNSLKGQGHDKTPQEAGYALISSHPQIRLQT